MSRTAWIAAFVLTTACAEADQERLDSHQEMELVAEAILADGGNTNSLIAREAGWVSPSQQPSAPALCVHADAPDCDPIDADMVLDALMELAANEPCPVNAVVAGVVHDGEARMVAVDTDLEPIGRMRARGQQSMGQPYLTVHGKIRDMDGDFLARTRGRVWMPGMQHSHLGTFELDARKAGAEEPDGSRVVGVFTDTPEDFSLALGFSTMCSQE